MMFNRLLERGEKRIYELWGGFFNLILTQVER